MNAVNLLLFFGEEGYGGGGLWGRRVMGEEGYGGGGLWG